MIRTISIKQLSEIEQAKQRIEDPHVNRKLDLLIMRANGANLAEIASVVGYSKGYVSTILSKYYNEGLDSIVKVRCTGGRRNMSFEAETAILAPFFDRIQRGGKVNTQEIKATYQAAVPHKISSTQIYDVLRRHGWSRGCLKDEPSNISCEESRS